MNSILQLFKYFGAFSAIILSIGFISKSDLSFLESRDVDSVKKMSLSSSAGEERIFKTEDTNRRVAAYNRPEAVVRNRPGLPVLGDRSTKSIAVSSSPKRSTAGRSKVKHNTISAYNIEEWVQMNVAQTYLEAEKETMSPGVILATGIYFLQQGKGDMAMNAADIADYLAEVRQHASSKAKARMKYIANSNEWFEGLKLAGFDGDKISSIFSSHELAAYDKQMYSRHVERKIEVAAYAVDDALLAADKVERRAGLADAYNDYADRPEVRKKYSLPTFVENKPMNSEEQSEGRIEAASFASGQTKKYNDPRVFWAVLKEMIALEHNYNSWEDYVKEHKRAARKEFENRSNIMAMGGVMKITRRKDGV